MNCSFIDNLIYLSAILSLPIGEGLSMKLVYGHTLDKNDELTLRFRLLMRINMVLLLTQLRPNFDVLDINI